MPTNLEFLVFIDPQFVLRARPENGEANSKEVPDDLLDKPAKPVLLDGPPPPSAVVVETDNRIAQVQSMLLALGFSDAKNWSVAFHKHKGKQIRTVRCSIEPGRIKTFMDWVLHPAQNEKGVRFYIPPRTRTALVALGVAGQFRKPRQRRNGLPPQPSNEARQRRHNTLYIYTTARNRGKVKTAEAARLDTRLQHLPEARLHVPGHGRTTAYCYFMPVTDTDEFVKVIETVLSLYTLDKGIRIVTRAFRAAFRLNTFIESLEETDAARVRALIGPTKALVPELKWKGAVPVRRTGNASTNNTISTNNGSTINTNKNICTDKPVCTDIAKSVESTKEVVVPSPRLDPLAAMDMIPDTLGVTVDGVVEAVQIGYGDEQWDEDEPISTKSTKPDKEVSTNTDADEDEASTNTETDESGVSEDDVMFIVFATGKPSIQLNQLLKQLPEGEQFQPGAMDSLPAASLQLARVDQNAVESFLSATMVFKKHGYHFAVNPEAEEWFDRLLDEYDEAGIAVVREVWARQS